VIFFKSMTIFVDADACPVKSAILEAAKSFSCPVVFVASVAHQLPVDTGAKIVQVDASSQAADLYICNHASRGDIVVTGDYGLAAIVLGKGCYVLSFTGREYTQSNMDLLLEERHFSSKVRRAGGRTRGPKAFTTEHRNRFHISLTNLLEKIEGN
jgi:uncharacterized protein YaiI (UPF0178 family)